MRRYASHGAITTDDDSREKPGIFLDEQLEKSTVRSLSMVICKLK